MQFITNSKISNELKASRPFTLLQMKKILCVAFHNYSIWRESADNSRIKRIFEFFEYFKYLFLKINEEIEHDFYL